MIPEIPEHILSAARAVDCWAKENGISHYEIGPVCSRDHAQTLRTIQSMLSVDYNNVQSSPSGTIRFFGFPKDDPQPKVPIPFKCL